MGRFGLRVVGVVIVGVGLRGTFVVVTGITGTLVIVGVVGTGLMMPVGTVGPVTGGRVTVVVVVVVGFVIVELVLAKPAID